MTQDAILVLVEIPSSPNICVAAGKPYFLDILLIIVPIAMAYSLARPSHRRADLATVIGHIGHIARLSVCLGAPISTAYYMPLQLVCRTIGLFSCFAVFLRTDRCGRHSLRPPEMDPTLTRKMHMMPVQSLAQLKSVRRRSGFSPGDQNMSEFRAALVNTHSMSDGLCSGVGSERKSFAPHECVFKRWDAVYSIKQA